MRIAIYTSDLTRENRHLMPWRMVLEIGKAACEAGHQVKVLAGRRPAGQDRWVYGGCPVEEIPKPYTDGTRNNLRRVLHTEQCEVLFWPTAWHSARRQENLCGKLSIPIIWYMPGACYSLGQAVRAVPALGVRAALPFLIQSIYPKRHLLQRLRRPDAHLLITASQFTRSVACQANWPAEEVFAIPPGKPSARVPASGAEPAVFSAFRNRLRGRPFYLFLGPPTRIRGITPLLQAFDIVANRHPQVCLVCLFRSDPGTDPAGIRREVQSKRHAERILCVWESVGKADLHAFFDACHAVVLPFLLVPSEIPLAIIEAAGHSKPVITTGPGGTGAFVQDFGLAVPAERSQALAEAMSRLLDDERLYTQKCAAAAQVYAAHPTWPQVAQRWLSVAEKAIQSPVQSPPGARFLK